MVYELPECEYFHLQHLLNPYSSIPALVQCSCSPRASVSVCRVSFKETTIMMMRNTFPSANNMDFVCSKSLFSFSRSSNSSSSFWYASFSRRFTSSISASGEMRYPFGLLSMSFLALCNSRRSCSLSLCSRFNREFRSWSCSLKESFASSASLYLTRSCL